MRQFNSQYGHTYLEKEILEVITYNLGMRTQQC